MKRIFLLIFFFIFIISTDIYAANVKVIQNNFTNGEVTPLLRSRIDYTKYQNSALEIKNFYTTQYGAASFRQGMEYIKEAKLYTSGTWTTNVLEESGQFKAMAYSSNLEIAVALNYGSSSTPLWTTDGINYDVGTGYAGYWNDVVPIHKTNPDLNIFVAVDGSATAANRGFLGSLNGKRWFHITAPENNQWTSVDYSPDLDLAVAVAQTGTNRVATSQDMVNWTARSCPSQAWQAVTWVGGSINLFVAVGEDAAGGQNVMTSANGQSWTLRSTPNANDWYAVTPNSNMDTIVAVGDYNSSGGTLQEQIMSSTDGTTWTARTSPDNDDMKYVDVGWSGSRGRFVAISDDTSSSNQIAESADGTTWTAVAASTSTAWAKLHWHTDYDMFVATSGTSTMMYQFGSDVVSNPVRLIPFVFSETQAYVIELGEKYARFYKDGAIITEPSQLITNITQANPAVITYQGGDNYSNGDRILITDVGGMRELNNREFEVASVNTGANTFQLLGVNSTNYQGFTSEGMIKEIVEITTPFLSTDLFEIDAKAQSGDILYMFHQDYAPQQLARLSDTSWTMNAVDFKKIPTDDLDHDITTWTSIDTSLTNTLATATAEFSFEHGFGTGTYITVRGANEEEYNGTFDISNVGSFTFDYTMTANPGATATGNLECSGDSIKPRATTGDGVVFVGGGHIFLDGDKGRKIISGLQEATIIDVETSGVDGDIKSVEALTRTGTTATAQVTGHGYSLNDRVVVLGADQDDYNGAFKIKNVGADTFDYVLTEKPDKTATGDDIICYKSDWFLDVGTITRSGTEGTVTTTVAHQYNDYDLVKIKNANESEYNDEFEIFNVATLTFNIKVQGSPSSPATTDGTITVRRKSPTNVITCNINRDFDSTDVIAAGDWKLRGNPKSQIQFSDRGQAGDVITITANKPCFRASDVGKHIRFPRSDTGKFTDCKIIKYFRHAKLRGEYVIGIHPDDGTTTAKNVWTLESEAWSDTLGWPRVGLFHEDRLWMAKGDTIYGSVQADYNNFNQGTDDDTAVEFTLNSREINDIVWMTSREAIHIGSIGAEWILGDPDSNDPITPSNVMARKRTPFGSAPNIPVIDTPFSTLFAQQATKNIIELTYDGFVYSTRDVTLLTPQYFHYGIKDMAFQKEPISLLWVITNEGQLCGLTYLPVEEVSGWHKHPTPYGFVESVAVIPGKKYDETWLLVRRKIDDTDRRYVERLRPQYGVGTDDWLTAESTLFDNNYNSGSNTTGYFYDYIADDEYDNSSGESAMFLDCAITYDDTGTTTIAGLWHFGSMTVKTLEDGTRTATYTVTNGSITLGTASSIVHIGFPYDGILRTQKAEFQTDRGTTIGHKRRINLVNTAIYSSGPFKIGDSKALHYPAVFERPTNKTSTVFTGTTKNSLDSRFAYDPELYIIQDEPYPLNILSVTQEIEID